MGSGTHVSVTCFFTRLHGPSHCSLHVSIHVNTVLHTVTESYGSSHNSFVVPVCNEPLLLGVPCAPGTQVEATQEQTRIVGLSATLPNYQDVGALLRYIQRTGHAAVGSVSHSLNPKLVCNLGVLAQ